MRLEPDGLPVRDSGEWVKRKHHYLRRYCEILTTAMRKKWSLTYVDLLAGPGRCKIDDTGELVPGSPVVALDCGFGRYVFCEANPPYAAALRERIASHPKAGQCTVVRSDWTDLIGSSAFAPAPDELVLAAIDPTGIRQIPWWAIEKLTQKAPHLDVFMTIQHQMGVALNQSQYLEKSDETALDSLLGSEDWRERSRRGPAFTEDILNLYKERWQGIGFGTSNWRLVRLDNRAPLYYVCVFSRHHLALRFWDEAGLKDEHGQTHFRL